MRTSSIQRYLIELLGDVNVRETLPIHKANIEMISKIYEFVGLQGFFEHLVDLKDPLRIDLVFLYRLVEVQDERKASADTWSKKGLHSRSGRSLK